MMLSSTPSAASSVPPTPPSTVDPEPEPEVDVDYTDILVKTDYQSRPTKKRRLFGDDEDLSYEPMRAPTNAELNASIRDFEQAVVRRDAAYYDRVRVVDQHLDTGEANPEWLDARRGRITGSKAIKACVKTTTVIQRRRFDSEMIHAPKFNSIVKKLVDYGNANEESADRSLRFVFERLAEYKDVDYDYPGLCINTKEPHIAMSPDGVWTVDSVPCLVEHKCRAYWCLNCDFKVTDDGMLMRKKKTDNVWSVMGSFFPPTTEDRWMLKDTELFPHGPRWPIPPKYLAQLRHGVYTIDHVRIKKIVFCAWICHKGEFRDIGLDTYVTPHGTVQVTIIDAADLADGCRVQKRRVDSYYRKTYLPNVCLKAGGYHGLYPPETYF